ncbi:MarR family winged helix-turn-helix transcriptional regulator [Microbacterium sp.]|uniref:MarR family winged helix-turn-helix transcriptional regulator n=1 Tax=Microbacterium sp. TaxID=51671 RepID=UPI0039E3B443
MGATAEEILKLENQLCFAIVTAARNVVSLYRPVLDPLGLTHPQYLVMLALWERAPRSLGDLAEELVMEPATLSPLVKRLEAQGRVARARRADDERVLEISLTEAGMRLRDEAVHVPGRIMELSGLDIAQVIAVRDGLAPLAGRRGSIRPAADRPADPQA